MGKKVNLTGQVFGRLTVLERDYSKKGKNNFWICQCNCENKTIKSIMASSLITGNTKSCGCLSKEQIKTLPEINKKYNTYDLTGEYGIGYASNTNEPFYFDLEDYDKIKNYCWYINKKDKYIETYDTKSDKLIRMHRLILDITNREIEVDHIQHVNYDNRKSQIRIATSSQNKMNTKTRKNKISGVKGVYWRKEGERWYATITKEGKTIYLGSSKDIQIAIKLRKDAEIKYFGEYSYDNSMKGVNNE